MAARHRIFPLAEHARLGHFLRQVRVEHNVSQRELAKRLNLPQSFISKVERGERQLQVLEFIEVCKQIGAGPAETLERFTLLEG